MCRLFGQLSRNPRNALEAFCDAPYSLVPISSAQTRRAQRDGWGVGWFDAAGRPRIVKSAKPLFEEKGRAAAAARQAVSRAVIGHVRAASNPKGLPTRAIMGAVNNQPFAEGSWLFAHNGTLEIPDEVAGLLGPSRAKLRSKNDSEVYFRQFLKFLAAYGDAGQALEACARETLAVWKVRRALYPKKRSPFTGLNAVVSNGRELHALSLYPAFPKLRSLGRGAQAWGTMSLRTASDSVLVASEDLDASGRWRRLPPGTLVSARFVGGRPRVRVRRLSREVLP
jgi:glutamine amidotransferase